MVAPGIADWVALDRHLDEVRACRRCPRVVPPPVVARPQAWPRIMLVGQAPGPREVVEQRPFAWTAGSRLFSWFERLGVDEAEFRRRVFLCAVIRCFPGRTPQGGDRVPSPAEIAACACHLEQELRLLRPGLVLAVGQLAVARFFPVAAPLAERVGKFVPVRWGGEEFDVLALPHPSGRSTWLTSEDNQALLDRAIEDLGRRPEWRETFG
jgi:uracil-DNA glycosylase